MAQLVPVLGDGGVQLRSLLSAVADTAPAGGLLFARGCAVHGWAPSGRIADDLHLCMTSGRVTGLLVKLSRHLLV